MIVGAIVTPFIEIVIYVDFCIPLISASHFNDLKIEINHLFLYVKPIPPHPFSS